VFCTSNEKDAEVAGISKLYKTLKKLNIRIYYLDNCNTFIKVFAKENYVTGKSNTKQFEYRNTLLRTRNRGLFPYYLFLQESRTSLSYLCHHVRTTKL
jgi:IS1 family transposase